jgi:hypothetical protein
MAHNLISRKYSAKGLLELRDFLVPIDLPSRFLPRFIGPPTLEKWKSMQETSIRASLSRSRNKIELMLRSNLWEWFITGTFSPSKVANRYDYAQLVRLVGVKMNNLRRRCPGLEYLIVFESHPTSGAWHWHGLLRNTDGLSFSFAKLDNRSGREIFNWSDWTYGFSTASRVGDSAKAETYLLKYITAQNDVPKFKRRFLASRGIDRSVIERFDLTSSWKRKRFEEQLAKTHETVSAKTVPMRKTGNVMTIRILREK